MRQKRGERIDRSERREDVFNDVASNISHEPTTSVGSSEPFSSVASAALARAPRSPRCSGAGSNRKRRLKANHLNFCFNR